MKTLGNRPCSRVISQCPTYKTRAFSSSTSFFQLIAHPSTMFTVSVIMSILHISLANEQILHHRHHRQDLQYHHHRKRSELRPLTIFECPSENYPKEIEDWMNQLSLKLETTEIVDSGGKQGNQNVSYGELVQKIGEEVKSGKIVVADADHNESMEMTAFSNPNETWGPNERLLYSKEERKISKFRLVNRKFQCPPGKVIKVFHWHPIWGTVPEVPDCCLNSSLTPELSNMSLIAEVGNLVWNKEESERHEYKREDYCIWRRGTGKSEWVSFKVCTSQCSNTNPCIRKCCPISQVVNTTRKECIPSKQPWKPSFYGSSNESGKREQQVISNFSNIIGYPDCPSKYFIRPSEQRQFKLLLHGTLVLEGEKKTYIKAGEFCIDGIFKDGGGYEDVVIACEPRSTTRELVDEWRLPLFSLLNGISALFLFVTDVVYLLLWRHQNIHGWLQFAYATSLLFTFSAFVVVQRFSTELKRWSFSCKMMGWITHLTYLSAFFWLTSMNFDLWWRFSRPLRTTRMTPKEKRRRRFLMFTLFSIGIPLLISSIGITLDYIYSDAAPTDKPPYIVPGFGQDRCYFESKQTQVPYLYAPAGILLLIDLIFFTSTVFHLRKMHAHTEVARTQSTMEDKKGLRIIAKLFVVMGVLWVFELASWVAYLVFPDKEMLLIKIFIPIDVLNSLQGVAIFFIFVCKPNVGNQLVAIFRTGISKTNFLQLQQSSNQSNQTNSTNMLGSNETLFTVQSDAGRD